MKNNIFLLVIIGLLGCNKDTSSETKYDLILSGGTVVDGLGNPSYRADVAVKGDKIVSVSKEGFNQEKAQDILDVSGRVVSPGSSIIMRTFRQQFTSIHWQRTLLGKELPPFWQHSTAVISHGLWMNMLHL